MIRLLSECDDSSIHHLWLELLYIISRVFLFLLCIVEIPDSLSHRLIKRACPLYMLGIEYQFSLAFTHLLIYYLSQGREQPVCYLFSQCLWFF